jgi:cytoskeleton protein RodZ
MNQQQELIPMATGEYLKQKRLEDKLSLADVARAISLDEKLLGEIEQDQAGHIAPVYRNGYIQAYARYLKLPEKEIQALVSSADNKEPAIRSIFSEPPKPNPLDKWLRATSYVLASLLIGTLAWQFTHEAVRLSQNGSQLPTRVKTTAIRGQAIQIHGPVSASIAPLGALHDNNAGVPDTAEQAWTAVSRPLLADGESRLQIRVSADSWVEITDASGQELEMDLLRGGSEKSYHGKPPFRILFGRASSVRLSVDGEPVDLTPFTRDDVVQFNWPQKLQAENKGSANN